MTDSSCAQFLAVDQNGLDFIKRWEGVRLLPYRCPAGKLTVGVGHVILPGEPYREGKAITQGEADLLLFHDLRMVHGTIVRAFGSRVQTQHQFNALASFAFNCGTRTLVQGSVWEAVHEGGDVPAALRLYCKARVRGVLTELPGLVARRKAEGELWSRK